MKTKAIYVLGALAVLSACQAKEEWGENKEQIRLSLSGDIEQLAVTRASANAFTEGDQVGIYAVNYDGDTPGTLALKGNQATNVRFTFDGTSTWTPDYDIYYKDKNTKVDIYGYYPYSSAISSVSEWPFEVQEDQSTVSAHGNMGGYEASDFLWAKRESVMPTSNAIQLLFQHKMSCVVVTLEEGTGFGSGEFAALSKSVLVNNVKRSATINLSTGVVTATGTVPARSTVPAVYESGFRAIVVPQTVSSSATLFSITLGGVAYSYSEATAFTYIAGKQHNFAVTVDKKGEEGYSVSVSTSISAWTNDTSSHDFTAKEYVVVNVETAGTLGETLTNAGKNPNAIKYLKVLGTVNANDFYYMRDNMSTLIGINMQETFVVNGKIPDNAFSGKTTLTTIIFPDGENGNSLTEIGANAFKGSLLTGLLSLPSSITLIGGGAFMRTKINAISFPSSLETISYNAFYGCDALTGSLSLPNGIRYIGGDAFRNCPSISGQLYLPDSIEQIDSYAFSGCTGITGKLVLPPKIQTIYGHCFDGCSGISSIVLPNGLKEISSAAFQSCGIKGELILPESLITISDGCFSHNYITSVSFPENLVRIGEYSFAFNPLLSGTIVFPPEITQVEKRVFEGCSNIEGIILHSNISIIGGTAFKDCFNINSIVCYSTEPPTVLTGAFDGVPKNNFPVEVPESTVSEYTYSAGWNEFTRITAHREFSISRRLYRTLNSKESRTLTVRAESGAAWHVDNENKPAWVTVSPDFGTGKTDVTVTIGALAGGSDNRDGDVAFILDGKDYQSILHVEQYDYAYGDGSVYYPEEYHSTVGSGIPIVFMGDCYDAYDIAQGDYLTDTQAAINHFFDIEPYKTYKDYFDRYIVFGKSEDSGLGSVNTIREAKFGTQYSLTGGALENDGTVAFQYAKLVDANIDLTKALVVMILNSPDYGGVTYMWNDGSAIALCPKSTDPYPYDFRGLVQHEAGGHGFGKLADEYIYVNAFIQACGCENPHLDSFRAGKANGWYKNLSETSNPNVVPWSHLMYHPNYSNKVDIYEGGYFHTRGIFRSEPNSCMNNNIPYYSAISRQAIVERIMDYAGEAFNLEDFYTKDAAAMTKAVEESPTIWMSTTASSVTSKTLQHHEPIIMGDHPNH